MKKHILLAIAALSISVLSSQAASARQGVSSASLPLYSVDIGAGYVECSWNPASGQTSDEAWAACLDRALAFCFEGVTGIEIHLTIVGGGSGYTFVPCPR